MANQIESALYPLDCRHVRYILALTCNPNAEFVKILGPFLAENLMESHFPTGQHGLPSNTSLLLPIQIGVDWVTACDYPPKCVIYNSRRDNQSEIFAFMLKFLPISEGYLKFNEELELVSVLLPHLPSAQSGIYATAIVLALSWGLDPASPSTKYLRVHSD